MGTVVITELATHDSYTPYIIYVHEAFILKVLQSNVCMCNDQN